MQASAFIANAPIYLSEAAPYTAAGALLLALIGTAAALIANRRIRTLKFRRGESVEDTLGELMRRVRELQAFREELEDYLKDAEGRIATSARGIGMVRFNPFQGDGSGGNQSFALALLNEHGTGVALSALYARTGQTSVYAKPIEKGVSAFALTEEEQEALRRAKESLRAGRLEREKPSES